MAPRWVLAATAAAAAWGCAIGCKDEATLNLVKLPSAKCADGSEAGFYVSEPAVRSGNIVVVLGDSELCENEEECNQYCAEPGDLCQGQAVPTNASSVKCYLNNLTCGSGLWPQSLAPKTVLCGDSDAAFKSDVRVFVPQCTLDWFLGNKNNAASSKLPNRFQGSRVITELVAELVSKYGLGAPNARLLLSGTRGGGVGAVNVLEVFKAAMTGTKNILTLLDSSYFITVRDFGVTDYSNANVTFAFDESLRRQTRGWIDKSSVNAECGTKWGDASAYKCLFPQNVLEMNGMRSNQVMVLQSQFDILMLKDLGVLDGDKLKHFLDAQSYSQAAFSFVDGFGLAQRDSYNSLTDLSRPAGGANALKFVAPACAQQGLIVPTSLHVVSSVTDEVGDAGALRFKRTGDELAEIRLGGEISFNSESGEKKMEGGVSLSNLISAWVANPASAEEIRADDCGDFLCNPTCPTKVIPFVLPVLSSPCMQQAVRVYVLMFFALMWSGFLVTLLRICAWRASCARYWRNNRDLHESGREVQKEVLREAAAGSKGRTIQLTVQNLSYWSPPKGSGAPYQILRNVSLNFQSGTVHALMGPSGSGKSTLLDVVAYTRDSGRVSGTHYINGVPSHVSRAAFLREWLRNSVSYVRQQDVLFPYLTVREHLQHAAWLMLPQFMDSEKKLRRCYQVIKLLELDKCADTICGDGGVAVEGGISGGQRRRVSVATQLLKMPAALLLDEPTSGLDSTNALLLVQCLKNLARKSGVTVIMTIHQPRKEIFVLLDKLSILVKGRVVFSGSPLEAASTFKVDITEANVGDTILDVLQACTPDEVDRYRRQYEDGPLGRAVSSSIAAVKTDLSSERAAALRAVLVENALGEGRWSWTEPTNSVTAMWVLMSRTIKRGGFDVYRTVPFSLFGGLLVGSVFIAGVPNYASQTALAYLAVSTMTFLQSTFLGDRYMAEKQMWSHELDNGTKVSWSALLLSLFFRNVVTSTLEGLAFALPAYFMGHLNYTPEIFLNFVLLMVLTSTSVVVQNTTVEIDRIRRGGESGPDTRQAVLINMSLLALSALFNGFIIQLQDIPVYLRWVPFCMLSYWGFVGVLINNFRGQSFPCDATVLECASRTGDNWIRSFQYDNRDVLQCMLALLILILTLHFVSVVDFYFRFARSTSRLKRGRPSRADAPDASEKDHDEDLLDGSKSPKSPALSNAGLDEAPHSGPGGGDRGRLLSLLLSRSVLCIFLLVDFLTAWNVCFFQDQTAAVVVPVDSSENGASGLGAQFSQINFSDVLSTINPVFVTLNVIVFCYYSLQFVVQICFLVPHDSDGKRSSILWISFWDLVALAALAADAFLLVALFAMATTTSQQVLFIGGSRFARVVFVACFWSKVGAFHNARAMQFLAVREQLLEENKVAVSSMHLSEEERQTSQVAPSESGSAPVLPPSRAKNRISGMFSRAPPPLPPSRVMNRSTMDLGPQWAAFQNPVAGGGSFNA